MIKKTNKNLYKLHCRIDENDKKKMNGNIYFILFYFFHCISLGISK